MAADRWGLSWGGDGGVWGFSWTLGANSGTTLPEYGPPFLTKWCAMTTTISRESEIVPYITRRSEINEDA